MKNLTPKEKAIELFNKYYCLENNSKKRIKIIEFDTAKQCALIAVNEIISQWDYIDTYLADLGGKFNPNLKYWKQVKQEIEKL